MEGKGKFRFQDGSVFVGSFKDGMFHGEGYLLFPDGGKYTATWDHGRVVEGSFTFADGLAYDEKDWGYCTDQDRRFFSEQVNGLSPAAPQ